MRSNLSSEFCSDWSCNPFLQQPNSRHTFFTQHVNYQTGCCFFFFQQATLAAFVHRIPQNLILRLLVPRAYKRCRRIPSFLCVLASVSIEVLFRKLNNRGWYIEGCIKTLCKAGLRTMDKTNKICFRFVPRRAQFEIKFRALRRVFALELELYQNVALRLIPVCLFHIECAFVLKKEEYAPFTNCANRKCGSTSSLSRPFTTPFTISSHWFAKYHPICLSNRATTNVTFPLH